MVYSRKNSGQSVPAQACWHVLLREKAAPQGVRVLDVSTSSAPTSAEESDLCAKGGNKVDADCC